MVYIVNITEMRNVWNPNHLFMDPVGDYFYRSLSKIVIGISPFIALKILSGLATLASLVLFHAVLLQLGIQSILLRLLSVSGLFFSRNFISMGISEEFFMIQMPLLMFILWCSAKWARDTDMHSHNRNNTLLLMIGILLGLTTAISINNAFLVFAFGIGVAVAHSRDRRNEWGNLISIWIASGIILITILIYGYFRSGAKSGFVSWLTAYQGNSGTVLRSLYGVEWTMKGIVISLSRLTYSIFSNFIDLGGLGIVAKSKVFSLPLEFTPDYLMVSIGALILALLIAIFLILMIWIIREGIGDPFVRIGIAWISGYLLFNFYWDDSSDQFYFQILPIVWAFILLAVENRKFKISDLQTNRVENISVLKKVSLLFLVVLIMTLNTLNSVAPTAFEDIEGKQNAHRDILQAGDMEIVTEWDGLMWMYGGDGAPPHKKISLMNLAMQPTGKDRGMRDLPTHIREHLLSGRRVIVARLYDLDDVARPWDELRKLGWPREKIRNLLKDFNSRIIGRIGGVTFRELSLPKTELTP